MAATPVFSICHLYGVYYTPDFWAMQGESLSSYQRSAVSFQLSGQDKTQWEVWEEWVKGCKGRKGYKRRKGL